MDEFFVSSCPNGTVWDATCTDTCISLEACQACPCRSTIMNENDVVSSVGGGPWGEVMDVFFCILPIIFLILVTVKQNPLPTTTSLPMAAILMYLVRLMYLQSDVVETHAAILLGLHEAWTPLSIMAGAITLFESMECTYCLPYMMREIKTLTAGHAIAELMLIFCFAYMVEGASGFGTPVALGAPMLVSSGHPALESVIVLLIFNTLATVWGAVGTPIWFGFGTLIGITEEEFIEISYQSSIALSISGLVVLPWILCLLVPKHIVKQNLLFIYLSWFTAVGPAIGLSFITYEFPSLLGGITGCIGTAILIQYKVGLSTYHPEDHDSNPTIDEDSNNENDNDGPVETKDHKKKLRPLNVLGTTSKKSLIYKRSLSLPKDDDDEDDEDTPHDTETGNNSLLDENNNVDDDDIEITFEKVDPPGMKAAAAYKTKLFVSFGAEDEIQSTKTKNPKVLSTKQSGGSSNVGSTRSTVGDEDTTTRNTNPPPPPDVLSVRGSVNDVDEHLGPRKTGGFAFYIEMISRTFPIWLVVVLLIVTRVKEIGLKELLTRKEPNLITIHFGTYGTFKLSASLVFELQNFLNYDGGDISWSYAFLYVPFFLPFTLVSLLAMLVYRKDMEHSPMDIARTVGGRLKNPTVALLGALVLVQLMLKSGPSAPARILGTILADWFQEAFIVVSPLLGVLGSFFSGSTTVSNLTFGEIQRIAATSIGTSTTTMLALQAVGASAGNGVCLNNIIAACAVVGIPSGGEGKILMQTYKYVFATTTIATIVMLAFFFRF